MILLALAAVAFVLFAGKSSAPSAAGVPGGGVVPPAPPTPLASATPQTPVINNATGGSLSAALGSAPAPPNYFATGNPGYDTQAKPVVRPVLTPRVNRSGVPFSDVGQIFPKSVPVTVRRGAPNVPLPTPTNPGGTLKPIIAARPVVVTRVGPEIASAFWTKLPARTA